MSDGLQWCLDAQAEAAVYLAGDGADKRGATQGLTDALMEECIIRRTLMV